MVHRRLQFLTFNVRSLIDRSRQIELANNLNYNDIDVAFIQECHLRRHVKVNIPGYSFIYDYSPIGVAVLIKNTIQYKRVLMDNVRFSYTLISIEMRTNDVSKKYLVGSIYLPCNMASTDLLEGLNKLLRSTEDYDGFIFGGDFNSKNVTWGDNMDNCNGKIFYEWLQDNTLEVTRICDSTPSYPNGSSFLDHFLITPSLLDVDSANFRISTLSSFSDHFPLKLEMGLDPSGLILRNSRFFISYKKTNWVNFRHDMSCEIIKLMPPANRNLSNPEIEDFISKFNLSFADIHNNHSEKIEIKSPKPQRSALSEKLFKIKHKWQKDLKKLYHHTGNRTGYNYRLLSKQIQLLMVIIKETICKEEAKQFKSRLQKIKPGPNAFQQIFQIVGRKKSPFCNKLTINNITTTSSSEIASYFRDYYSEVFQETIPERPVHDLDTRVSASINSIPGHIYTFDDLFNAKVNSDDYHFVGPEKIESLMNNINSKKSSGVDGISNFIIKKLPKISYDFLAILFNNCINNGYFPAAWKTAKIIPIKKHRNSNTPDEFRPISLLSNIGKLFEHIIKEKINNEFLFNPISNYQFGFQQFHSTQHALLKFHSDITNKLREKTSTDAISLDIQKAFDSACQKGIIYKLIQLNVDPYLIKLMHNFFLDRIFNVLINDSFSETGLVKSGVPQGSVLAPFLFCLFLHDFPHLTRGSKAILYADDCMIYAHSLSPIQALNNAAYHLGLISAYYKTWGITINAAKSEAICIRNASGKCHRSVVPQSKSLHLSLDGIVIPFKNNIKYLGVNVSKLFKFNNHARITLQKAKRVTGMFSRILNNDHLPQNTKLLIYKVAIRSILTYGFPIWYTMSPTAANEIEMFERKIIRKCIGKNFENPTKRFSNNFIYHQSAIQPFCSYGLSLQKRFVEKLVDHDNCLMNEIFSAEQNTTWSSTTYLSPVGIISQDIEDNPHTLMLPDFYKKTTPGTHRG